MSRALQITGQSIDIELVRPCLVAFGKQFASRFGEAAQERISRDTLVDMICRARDEAEQVLRVEALGGHEGERGGSSLLEADEMDFWMPHVLGTGAGAEREEEF